MFHRVRTEDTTRLSEDPLDWWDNKDPLVDENSSEEEIGLDRGMDWVDEVPVEPQE
jgi:hypothetical protein